jgi:uncharacterized membrane protein
MAALRIFHSCPRDDLASRKRFALAAAIGRDSKGIISLVGYTIAIIVAFYNPIISLGLYAAVAMHWFIPDRRIEKTIGR